MKHLHLHGAALHERLSITLALLVAGAFEYWARAVLSIATTPAEPCDSSSSSLSGSGVMRGVHGRSEDFAHLATCITARRIAVHVARAAYSDAAAALRAGATAFELIYVCSTRLPAAGVVGYRSTLST